MPSEPAPTEGNPTPGFPPRAAQDHGCFRRRLALVCSVGSRLFLSTDSREASDLIVLAALCSRSGEEMSAGGLRDDSTEPRAGDRRPPLTLSRLSGGPATLRRRFSHAEVATRPGDEPRCARAHLLLDHKPSPNSRLHAKLLSTLPFYGPGFCSTSRWLGWPDWGWRIHRGLARASGSVVLAVGGVPQVPSTRPPSGSAARTRLRGSWVPGTTVKR